MRTGAALDRRERDRGHALEHTQGEIARIDMTIEALDEAIDKAADVLQAYQTQHATGHGDVDALYRLVREERAASRGASSKLGGRRGL